MHLSAGERRLQAQRELARSRCPLLTSTRRPAASKRRPLVLPARHQLPQLPANDAAPRHPYGRWSPPLSAAAWAASRARVSSMRWLAFVASSSGVPVHRSSRSIQNVRSAAFPGELSTCGGSSIGLHHAALQCGAARAAEEAAQLHRHLAPACCPPAPSQSSPAPWPAWQSAGAHPGRGAARCSRLRGEGGRGKLSRRRGARSSARGVQGPAAAAASKLSGAPPRPFFSNSPGSRWSLSAISLKGRLEGTACGGLSLFVSAVLVRGKLRSTACRCSRPTRSHCVALGPHCPAAAAPEVARAHRGVPLHPRLERHVGKVCVQAAASAGEGASRSQRVEDAARAVRCPPPSLVAIDAAHQAAKQAAARSPCCRTTRLPSRLLPSAPDAAPGHQHVPGQRLHQRRAVGQEESKGVVAAVGAHLRGGAVGGASMEHFY